MIRKAPSLNYKVSQISLVFDAVWDAMGLYGLYTHRAQDHMNLRRLVTLVPHTKIAHRIIQIIMVSTYTEFLQTPCHGTALSYSLSTITLQQHLPTEARQDRTHVIILFFE